MVQAAQYPTKFQNPIAQKTHPPPFMKTESKIVTPPLSERTSVFPSSSNAAASLKLPVEVFKLARVRGVPCFHASNRVHEAPFIEFVLERLLEYFPPLPEETREIIEFDYTLAEVLEMGPIYENTFSNEQFQIMRLLWGDKSAIKARDKRLKELRKVAAVAVPAVSTFRDATKAKAVSPYVSAGLTSLDEWDITCDPFISLGADKLAFWSINERFIDMKRREIYDCEKWVPIDHTNDFPPCLIKPKGKMLGDMPPIRKVTLIDWQSLVQKDTTKTN